MIDIIANSVFFLSISSGSVLAAAAFDRKYEQVLPLSTMAIVLVLFLFGVFSALRVGVYVILSLCAVMYLFSFGYIVVRKRFRSFLNNFFTTPMFLFLLLFLVLSFLNRGMAASLWDEFSHWVDITKVMTLLDDFGTNPLANSAFQTYPPAMSLFQYFLQKIRILFDANGVFHEGSVYFAYQIFFISVLMPFLGGVSFKKPLKLLAVSAAAFLFPLLFYSDLYTSTYIDAFLGILSGAGLAALFLSRRMTGITAAYVLLLCATLVLSKDMGLFLAVILSLCFLVSSVYTYASNDQKRKVKLLALALISVLAVALPKILWSWEISTAGIEAQGDYGIDFVGVLDFLHGNDHGYRLTVIANFVNALFERSVTFGNTGIRMNYFGLVLTQMLLLYLAYRLYRSIGHDALGSKKAVLIAAAIQQVLYIVGLCFLYAFRFGEYEALNLASFERYMNVPLLASMLFVVLIVTDAVHQKFKDSILCSVIAIYIFLMIAPMRSFVGFVGGAYADRAAEVRSNYTALTDEVLGIAGTGSKVYLISQESSGFDYWALRYSIRPCTANEPFTWSLGEPFFDGDIWTTPMSAVEWQTVLVEEYDYVALYNVNDYFVENYAVLFADPQRILDNTVYAVNKQTGLLEICE